MNAIYNVWVRTGKDFFMLPWGDKPREILQYKHLLDSAEELGLISSDGSLPPISVGLDRFKRWIIVKRRYGRYTLHAIGWQTTARGINIKAIIWVYPDGSIELGDEPRQIIEWVRDESEDLEAKEGE